MATPKPTKPAPKPATTAKAPAPPKAPRLVYVLAVSAPDVEGDALKIVEALKAAPKHTASVADVVRTSKLKGTTARRILRALRDAKPAIVKVVAS
jgi:hypothetical protein